MIKTEKMQNALYAIQGVLIRARQMAHDKEPFSSLADLLDSAEMLPRLIASETDETASFRRYLADIAEAHKCEFVLQRFDEPTKQKW